MWRERPDRLPALNNEPEGVFLGQTGQRQGYIREDFFDAMESTGFSHSLQTQMREQDNVLG